MKKNLFWKIIVIWLMLLLTVMVISNLWQYHWVEEGRAVYRINKITGVIQAFSGFLPYWRTLNKSPDED